MIVVPTPGDGRAERQRPDPMVRQRDLEDGEALRVRRPAGEGVGTRLAPAAAMSLGLPAGSWESVGFHAAFGLAEYSLLAPTRSDSTSGGVPWEAFCVTTHNSEVPHSAFRGETPDEMYFGTGSAIPGELEATKKKALQRRLEANRAMSCSRCSSLMEAAAT